MNNQCRSAIAENGVAVISPIHVFVHDLCLRLALCVNGDILHVAGVVAFGILQSVLFIIGIEMRAGRLEIGWIALRILVDVDGMFSRWQIVQVELDHHALFPLIHKR